jgi:pyruvate kinase
MSKTKIIATLGPSSESYTVIMKMVMAGLEVVRLNFSHGTYEAHLNKMKIIERINGTYGRRIKVLQDLEGYRIRICHFKRNGEKLLEKGKTVWLTSGEDTGESDVIPFDYQGDLARIKSGQLIYIDDGNIILRSEKPFARKVKALVVEGGVLKERKGVNMPGVNVPFSGVTEKDMKDMDFGIRHKVDYIAQSFVRTRDDIDRISEHMGKHHPACRIVAKIESKEAIRNIDSIIDASDGIMVARGDMGIAVPIYEIPVIQKMIIRKCNNKKKFVITATQMLEHMTEHSRPTRAEVTDVANAIIDGTNFVMLSEESAAGKYPVEAVKMMEKIIRYTEQHIKRVKRSGR